MTALNDGPREYSMKTSNGRPFEKNGKKEKERVGGRNRSARHMRACAQPVSQKKKKQDVPRLSLKVSERTI
jgi:hypothetical protein